MPENLEILKTQFLSALEDFSGINVFLGDSLRTRLIRPDWLLNPIIQALLSTENRYTGNPKPIDSLVKRANSSIVIACRSELNPDEEDFDLKIWDVLAEIGASVWLAKNGHSEVKKVPKSNVSKTPEFESLLGDKECVTEVKHLRKPYPEEDELLRQLRERVLRIPDLYTREFDIRISGGQAFEDEVCGTEDRIAIKEAFNRLDGSLKQICSGVEEIPYTKKLEGKNGCVIVAKRIRIEFVAADRFKFVLGSTSHQYSSNSNSIGDSIVGLKHKTRCKVEEAIQQLNRLCNTTAKCRRIVLCWDKPSIYIALNLDDRANDFQSYVKDMESEKRRDYPSLEIKLLGWGEIMDVPTQELGN